MEKIVTHFLKGGILPAQIGVITPYEGQRAHVVTTMQRVGTLRQVGASPSSLYDFVGLDNLASFQMDRRSRLTDTNLRLALCGSKRHLVKQL